MTYASGKYKKNIFWNKLFISIYTRPDKSFFYTDDDLHKTDFYKKYRDVFDAEIGTGYWAWKPWVVSNLLKIPAFFELQSILVMTFRLVFLSRNKYYA
jgi:hypothetical protein